jgi:hypothetical protein
MLNKASRTTHLIEVLILAVLIATQVIDGDKVDGELDEDLNTKN